MSKVDYQLDKIKGIVFDVDGVLSPSTIPLGPDGVPSRMANIKDGYALQLAVKHGIKMCIITGADSEAIRVRYNALGITDVFTKAGMKLPALQKWMKANGLTQEEVAYVGDDIPDFECMTYVGLPVAPADAAIDIKSVSRYITTANGGYGVARELIEEILRDRGQWMNKAKAFGW